MNGIHDMGGKHGFGKIQYLPEEPPFREEWEGECSRYLPPLPASAS
jgi:hypothetical protein